MKIPAIGLTAGILFENAIWIYYLIENLKTIKAFQAGWSKNVMSATNARRNLPEKRSLYL
jgi:hypothetical protein